MSNHKYVLPSCPHLKWIRPITESELLVRRQHQTKTLQKSWGSDSLELSYDTLQHHYVEMDFRDGLIDEEEYYKRKEELYATDPDTPAQESTASMVGTSLFLIGLCILGVFVAGALINNFIKFHL